VQSTYCGSSQKGTTNDERKDQPTWVGINCRDVEDEPIEVNIACIKPQRVEARPAAEGGGIVAETEVIQAAGRVEPAALVQVAPGEGAGRKDVPVGVEHRRLTEGVVDVTLHHISTDIHQAVTV
jgi:hypothetical protein